MGSTFTGTRSHEKFMEQRWRLTELADTETLTRAQLDEAMAAMYDDGDYIDRSIGMEWLLDNPERFNQTAQRCGFTVTEFFHMHGRLCWVGSRVLSSPAVLRLVPDSERTTFVQRMYRAHGSFNSYWIESVLSVGVSRETVAALIQEGLEAVPDNCEASGMVDQVKEFLDCGWRAGEPNSPWSVLTADEFDAAMTVCARKAPGRFFDKQEEIERRLRPGRWNSLALEALPRLKRLSPAQQRLLEQQPLEYQLEIATKLDAAPTFLVGLLVRLPEAQGKAQLEQLERLFDGMTVPDLYRKTWAIRHEGEKPKARWLEDELQRRLTAARIFIGTVQRGTFQPRTGPARTQLEVKEGNLTYVMERSQRGWYPKPGDQVLICRQRAHWLTPRVGVLNFIPARLGDDVRNY